jgi:hypothetical protein
MNNNKIVKNSTSVDSMITSLIDDIKIIPKEYFEMSENISKNLDSANLASTNFYKAHSQFHNTFLDITELTPINTLKHILARIERKKSALSEAHFKRKKSEIEIRRKQDKLETTEDLFDKELLEIEIEEIICGIAEGDNYIKGAIREMSFLMTQYNSIMKKIGKEYITEEDYERDERRYHIMTAFKQALNSCRPRNGVVDEGNTIYFFDLGINAQHAQIQIYKYLKMEQDFIKEGKFPTHEMTLNWLEECADLFENSLIEYAERKGLIVIDEKSLCSRKI